MSDGHDGGVRSDGEALVVDAPAAVEGQDHAVEGTGPVAQESVVPVG